MPLLSSRNAAIGLVIGCILFCLGSLIVAYLPIGAYAVAFWRLFVASIIFFGLSYFSAQGFPKKTLARRYALVAGAFLGLDLALWHESIYAVGPGISTLLNSLQIFWLSAIGFLFYFERQTHLQLFSLFLAVVGITLIASPEFQHNQGALWGFVSGGLSGLFLALSMLFVRKTHEVEPTPIFPLMLLISFGGMVALFMPTIILDYGKILPTNWQQVGLIIIYGAVMQCLAWGLIAYSIPMLSLSLTGLLLLTEPVAALMIDASLLHKPINTLQWCGAGLTLLAIYLGSLKRK